MENVRRFRRRKGHPRAQMLRGASPKTRLAAFAVLATLVQPLAAAGAGAQTSEESGEPTTVVIEIVQLQEVSIFVDNNWMIVPDAPADVQLTAVTFVVGGSTTTLTASVAAPGGSPSARLTFETDVAGGGFARVSCSPDGAFNETAYFAGGETAGDLAATECEAPYSMSVPLGCHNGNLSLHLLGDGNHHPQVLPPYTLTIDNGEDVDAAISLWRFDLDPSVLCPAQPTAEPTAAAGVETAAEPVAGATAPAVDAGTTVNETESVPEVVAADAASDGSDGDEGEESGMNLLLIGFGAVGLLLIGVGAAYMRYRTRNRDLLADHGYLAGDFDDAEGSDDLDWYMPIGGSGSVDEAYLPRNFAAEPPDGDLPIRRWTPDEAAEPSATEPKPTEPTETKPQESPPTPEYRDPGPTSVRPTPKTTPRPASPPGPPEPTSCDWELHYWTGSQWRVLREASFQSHKCCVFKVSVQTYTGAHDQVTAVRQDVDPARAYIPDYDFSWKSADFWSVAGTRSGPADDPSWRQGLGEAVDPSNDSGVATQELGTQGRERPEVVARISHQEGSELVVTLESGCPGAVARYAAWGSVTSELTATHECTNIDPEPSCPVELNAFGAAAGKLAGDLNAAVSASFGTDPDQLDGASLWDGHDHEQQDRATYRETVSERDEQELRGAQWRTSIETETSLDTAHIVPIEVRGTTDRTSTYAEQTLAYELSLTGSMDKGDCGSRGCCTGKTDHTCNCEPSFSLHLTGAGSSITVDGKVFGLERDPIAGDRTNPPAPSKLHPWKLT